MQCWQQSKMESWFLEFCPKLFSSHPHGADAFQFLHWFQHKTKKNRKKKRKQPHCKNRPHRRSRYVGICRRAAGRRYRVKFKTYRFYGQRKRCQMLKRLHTSRATQAQKLPHLVKQAKPLPMVSQLSTWQWVCGLLGFRVGEASHRGPAKIGTKRKAENEPQSHDDADAGLANALLNVLQQYQGEPNTRPYQVWPPVTKKGKGGPTPVPTGSRLARVLRQTLQAALSQGWTDQQVAQRLATKISRYVPEKMTPNNHLSNMKRLLGERLYDRIAPSAKEHIGKVTGMILELPVKRSKGSCQMNQLFKQVLPKPWRPWSLKGPTPGSIKSGKTLCQRPMAKAKEKAKLLTAFVPYVLLQISNLWNGQVNLSSLPWARWSKLWVKILTHLLTSL